MRSQAMDKHESKYFHTAEVMDEALIALLSKKDYAYISVKELCKKAGVNRSTFYLHYESMDDLLEETIASTMKKFNEAFEDQDKVTEAISKGEKEGTMLISNRYLIPYLNFVKENKIVFALTKKKPNLFRSEENFKTLFDEYLSPIMEMFDIPEWERGYISSYYLSGIVTLVSQWVNNGCEEDVGTIADLINRLVYPKKIQRDFLPKNL